MNFLTGATRILRLEGIIRGDDDAPTDFDDTQHAATLSLAQLAIQEELTNLIVQEMLPYESASDTITTAAGTRTYTLASDFIQFDDTTPALVEEDSSGNATSTILPEYPGGEARLRIVYPMYREQTGTPTYFYPGTGATKNVALYQVPSEVKTYRYYYQASVSVTDESDTLPFVAEEEAQTFISIAARRFKYLHMTADKREALFPGGLERDPVIGSQRAILMRLLDPSRSPNKYGRQFSGAGISGDGW